MNNISRYGALLVAGLLVTGTAYAQNTSSPKQPAQEGDAQNLYDGQPKVFNEIAKGQYFQGKSDTQLGSAGQAQKQPTQEGDAQNLYDGRPKVFNEIAKGQYFQSKPDTQYGGTDK